MTVAQTMSAEEFLAQGEDWRGRRYQLVEGEVVLNAPRLRHQVVVGELFYALESWSRSETGRGRVTLELDVRLNDRNVYQPDLLCYPADAALDGYPYPLPSLAVEVRSPSTWRLDIGPKKRNYEERGLPELWLVDTDASVVLVFRRSSPEARTFDVSTELAAGEVLTSPLLPGFTLPVEELFA